MTLDQIIQRRHYHLRWYGKYAFTALLCFSASLYMWPRRVGLLLMALGYAFYALARRERHRMDAVGQ